MKETATNPTYTTAELAELDSISRQIDIDASAATVWQLIARPGWYINEGAVEDDVEVRREKDDQGCDIDVVVHPRLGEFYFRTVQQDKPRYAAYRWLGTPHREKTEGTLVEFWIDEREDGGVTLRVLESGFSTVSDDPAVWLKEREGNDQGWSKELAAGRAWAEARS